MDFPSIAISVQQPWAFFLVNGFKPVENRTWPIPEKYIGARVLIQASGRPLFPLAAARETLPGLKLLFLGKMHISDDFKARMKPFEERFAPDIVKIGEKPPTDVPRYLAASDALLLPMDDDPIEKARFPIRFGDYLASGVPVVSNAVGEIKRIMETRDCGYTAPVDDPAAFGQAIVTALTDTADRQRKHDNAHTLIAEELNWPAVAARLEAIYEQTLAG